MQTPWTDLAAGYILASAIVIGLPMIFFAITFLPGLMRTTGEQIGAERTPRQPRRPTARQQSHRGQSKTVSARRKRNHERVRNFSNTA
jgi:hypothetical protein